MYAESLRRLIRTIVSTRAGLCAASILFLLAIPRTAKAPQLAASPRIEHRAGRLDFSAADNNHNRKSIGAAGWSFEPNVGQFDRRVRFLARAQDTSIFLTQNALFIAWQANQTQRGASGRSAESVRIEFADANHEAKAIGEDELPEKTNYLVGRNRSAWRLNVPDYSSVRYANLYPGVGARIYGGEQGLEYDLTAARASDVSRISLRIEGAKISVDSRGDLLMHAAGRTLLMKRPRVYQRKGSTRTPIHGGYRILSGGDVRFALGEHQPNLPIVIDPIISVAYTTFLGGAGAEKGNSVAVDAAGKVYVGGETTLPIFPADSAPGTLGSENGNSVLFVAKIDPSQSGAASLDYLTFIGGSGAEHGGMIAVDNSAVPPRLAVLGWTTSADFPVNDNSALSGSSDLTVTELDGAGNAIVYSKYLGGSGAEASQNFGAVAVDSTGDVFVTSDTTSADFPITSATAFHSTYGSGMSDGILAELAPGSATTPGTLVYSTYLGINAQVGVTGVAVDASKRVYLSGFTSAPVAFPSVNPFQATYAGGAFDGFVMEINPGASGSAGLIYSSLLGGSGSDQALSIRVDAGPTANAYVVGVTQSPDLLSSQTITNTPFQPNLHGPANGFVAVLNQSTGKPALQYLSYIGGTKSDQAQAVAVVSPTQIYVAGTATSADFPVLCTLQGFSGTQDAFVSELNPSIGGASSLLSTTFLGGTAGAEANGVAALSDKVVILGDTASADFPLAGNPQNGVQPVCASCQSSPAQSDAFLTILKADTTPSGCVAFNPSVATLGSFADGASSPPLNILVTNSGNAALNIADMTITGTNAADFVLSQNNCLSISPIPAGGSCDFSITFVPSVIGLETASLQVTDDGIGSPQTLDLRGTGTGFGITLNPALLNFPDTSQGQTNPNFLTVTLTNTGSDDLSISAVPQLTGTNAADFVIGSSSTCRSATLPTLVPGGTCTVIVEFTPNEPNPPETLSAQAVVMLGDPSSQASESVSIPVSGTEVAVAPAVALSPASLNFNSENVGSVTSAQTILVTNDGSAPLAIASVSVAGTNAADFSETNTCPLSPVATLAAGANCTISVKFQPSASGQRDAAISITDNAGGSPQAISLTGIGTAISVNLNPASLTFSAQDVGAASSPQSVTLQNTGSGPLTISSLSLTGANAADFSQKNNCPAGPAATLAAGLSCTIDVTFDPAATGSRAASLTISDDAGSSPQSVALSGTGTAPAVQFSALSVQFGATLVGTSAGSTPVQVSNSGNAPLLITQVGFTGADANDFRASGSCVGASVSIAPGSTCEIDVNFKPTAVGMRSAVLSVADNAAGSPQQAVQLSGTATDFELVPVAGGSTSAIIDAGQTANFNLQVASVNGFAGAPSLSCTSSIPAATCSVMPAQVTVASNQNAPFSVMLATASRSMGAPLSLQPHHPTRLFILVASLLALLCIVLFSRTGRRARLITGLALSSASLLCSCGSTASSSVKGTPAGNYMLTITGSISGATRTLNLSVTVK